MLVPARPWVVVQHVPFEGPGLIATALAAAGQELDVRRMDLGDPLPEPSAVAGLVVMGGPMGALDDVEHPYLASERALLAACVARRVPVLGVCLGAQLLAAALGARVYRGAAPEIGLGRVSLTEAARLDPVFSPAGHTLPVLHWHADTFDLPDGAVLLASSGAYAHQAYRVGTAYGLQFHVEIAEPHAADIEPFLPPDVVLDRRHLALVSRAGSALLERLVDAAVREAEPVELAGRQA